jgi:hypothetical protein
VPVTARHIAHEPREPIDFTPVPRDARGARSDGWTEARQREFIDMLAATGSVRAACRGVGLQPAGIYRLRHRTGAESFRAAWDAAVERGTQQVRDILIDHSLNGVPESVWWAGKEVGERRKFNHNTMRWIVERGERGRGRTESDEDRDRNEALAQKWVDDMLRLINSEANDERMRIRHDPQKRAAYELLRGPVDWDNLEAVIAAEAGAPPPPIL